MVFSGVVNTCLKCDMSQWFHCGGTDVVPESSGFLVSGATPEARRLVRGEIDVVCEKKKTSINLYEQNPFFEFCFLYQLVIKQTATQSVFCVFKYARAVKQKVSNEAELLISRKKTTVLHSSL